MTSEPSATITVQPIDLVAILCTEIEKEPRILLAVLFGSQARGEARPDSDIDLAILVDDPAPHVVLAPLLGIDVAEVATREGRTVDDVTWLQRLAQRLCDVTGRTVDVGAILNFLFPAYAETPARLSDEVFASIVRDGVVIVDRLSLWHDPRRGVAPYTAAGAPLRMAPNASPTSITTAASPP